MSTALTAMSPNSCRWSPNLGLATSIRGAAGLGKPRGPSSRPTARRARPPATDRRLIRFLDDHQGVDKFAVSTGLWEKQHRELDPLSGDRRTRVSQKRALGRAKRSRRNKRREARPHVSTIFGTNVDLILKTDACTASFRGRGADAHEITVSRCTRMAVCSRRLAQLGHLPALASPPG